MRSSKKLFRLWSLAAIVAMLVAMVPVGGPAVAKPVSAQPADLYFSEYVEGSSFNKALEIYNGTGSAIDLAAEGYSINIYFNGSSSPGTNITLTGSLADGDVFVVADDGADAAVLAQTDLTSTSNFFNGDDAVVLTKSGSVVDSIGQRGTDPGSQWGSGNTSTENNTLRRQANVCQGDTDPSDSFDLAAEWDGFAQDVFDGLGAHTADCAGDPEPPTPQPGPDPDAPELQLTELVVTPTGGEFVEIHNPTGSAIDLSDVYLTDATYAPGGTYYYNIVTGSDAGGGGFSDFHARFPDGASIGAGEYQTISMTGSVAFIAEYGIPPTYELFDDGSADGEALMREALTGSINGQGGLTDDGEVVVLYYWDGLSDLVTDLDYAVWGDKAEAVDKTGIALDGPDGDSDVSGYLPDTSVTSQDGIAGGPHSSGSSWQREDLTEGAETQSNGNGSGGDDETSEDLSTTWCDSVPTPGETSFCPTSVPNIIINELDADTPGSDSLEFIELYDGGTGNQALDGLVVVLFNGSDDASYNSFDLDGYSTNGDGYFLLGNSGVTPTPDIIFGGNGLQNGADAVAVYQGDSSEFPNDTPVTQNSLIDAVVYDTNDGDDAGLLPLLNAGQPQVNEGGAGNKDNHSNQRCPNGTGGPRNTVAFAQYGPSPGSENLCMEVVELLKIHEVQGDGAASPVVGSTVLIEGIVVGDFQDGSDGVNGDLNGFHVQEEDVDADGNSMTSEGIFVFDGSSPAVDVQVGDLVQVEGSVSEFFNLTEITSFSGVTVVSSGNPLPTPAEPMLPVSDVGDFEAYEGMSVRFEGPLYISEFFNYDRFGEIVLTTARQFQATAVFDPGSPESFDQALQNSLSRITLDDGRTNQNPDPARHPNGAEFTLANRFRGGDTLTEVIGVMDYSFGLYKIQPTSGANYTAINSRPLESPDVGGEIQVAAFNVLNYFTTLDQGPEICGPLGNLECRGADTPEELTRQRAKIVAALAELNADVVGLIEIENHPADIPTADLVSGVNDLLGPGTYDYISTGAIGPDAIRQAFIYKPDTVTLVGSFAALDTNEFLDPNNLGDAKNRPAVTQTFMSNDTGGMITVSVNHLKSKGSSCDAGDDDPQAGSCNLTRTLAAEELVDWLATGPTGYPEVPVMIIGDLNSYDKEDPIDVFKAAGYDDLLLTYQGENAYSYVFDGQLGYLDYAMASSNLLQSIEGTAAWHINADEPDILDYDTSFKQDAQDALYEPNEYRSSDHDPVVVGLSPLPQCNSLNATIYVNPDGVIVGGPWDGRDYSHVIFGTPGDDVIVGTNLSDVIHGKGGNDVICGLEGDDVIQARRGNDYLDAGAGNDVVIGHFGDDVLIGDLGNDTLVGMQGDDELYGGPGRDLLNGHRGTDVCNGGDDGDRDRAVQCEEEIDIP